MAGALFGRSINKCLCLQKIGPDLASSNMQRLCKPSWSEKFTIDGSARSRATFLPYSTNVPQARARDDSRMPHVLSVAGSDSGGGAGIQADLKACGALGVYCSTAITAITAQNTAGVQGIHVTPDDILTKQLESVLSDMEVDVVKTGMLPTAQTINILCDQLELHHVQGLVVDPVMVATSGDRLASDEMLDVLCQKLLPKADIVTPNLSEASILSHRKKLHTLSDMREAAKVIKNYGPRYVLVKGGHMEGSDDLVDVLYDGTNFSELHGVRIETRNTHGTGCTLASAIAAEMANGFDVVEAVKGAKYYIQDALEHSERLMIGKGPHGPLNHLFVLTDLMGKQKNHTFKPSDLQLYALTDSRMNRNWQRTTAEAVKSVIEGGATMVQLREKEAESGDFLKEAVSCLEVARKFGVPLIINDRVDIALACGADGVHLGQTDLPVCEARSILGPHKIIGASCKTLEQVMKAHQDGADYVGCGGVYPTTTKQDNKTIGLELLRVICELSPLPVVAIGGINGTNVEEVLRPRTLNLHGVAMVSGLFDKPDIQKEACEVRGFIGKLMK